MKTPTLWIAAVLVALSLVRLAPAQSPAQPTPLAPQEKAKVRAPVVQSDPPRRVKVMARHCPPRCWATSAAAR